MCSWSDRSPVKVQVNTYSGGLGEGDVYFLSKMWGERGAAEVEIKVETVE